MPSMKAFESNMGVGEVVKRYYEWRGKMWEIWKLLLNPNDVSHIEPHWRPGTHAGKPLKLSEHEGLKYLQTRNQSSTIVNYMSFLRTLFCQDCGHKSDQNYSRIQIKAPHRLLHVKTKLGLNQFSEQQKQKALPSPPSKSRWHAVCLWHLTGNIESAEKIIILSRFGVEYKLHTESMNSVVVRPQRSQEF